MSGKVRKPAVGEFLARRDNGKVLEVTHHYAYLIGVRYLGDRDESYRIGPNEVAHYYVPATDVEWEE